MITITESTFADYRCLQLSNAALSVWVTTDVGPRIIGLAAQGGDNLLAVAPNASYTTPSGARYAFRGGHRLWHAPEDAERSYVPDDAPLHVAQHADGVTLRQPIEASTGIEKTLRLTLDTSAARLIVDHMLTVRGLWPVTLAPWALTQLRSGGRAILPQPAGDPALLLPNRRLALWPYTPINSPHIRWGDRYILIDATLQEGKLKLGWANPAGWQAYALDGTLFVKAVDYQPGAAYPDYGSSAECYCDRRFLELETLGPLVTLEPGDSTHHREVWQLFALDAPPETEADAAALAARLGLAA